MAAPERIERVPISEAVNPNVGSPPPIVQTARRVFRRYVDVILRVAPLLDW
jgi:hypothetical protein